MQKKKKKITCYLAGAIETTDDLGRGWREEYKKELDKIGIEGWIPNDLNQENELPQEMWEQLKKEDLPLFRKMFRKNIMFPDLRMILDSTFTIVRFNGEITSGTHHEAGYACDAGIPTYLVTQLPFHEMPSWLLACCSWQFHSLEELVGFLKKEYP